MIEEDVITEYIKRYEVGLIDESSGRHTILVTNDLEAATNQYNDLVFKSTYNDKYHQQIFLYDYDKNCNLNYYDNKIDS